MPKPIEHPGSFESTTNAASYTDLAGAYLDLDAGGTFAQVGAKGPGSIGTKIRTVLAGVALTVLTFTAPGVATFLENVNMSSGKTFAAQAITATTITATGIIRNDGASGGFAMGVISSVPRITYNSSTTSFAFLTGGNGDATLTTGHLYAESDAIFDIGQSTSLLRFRDLFLSRNINLAGSVFMGAGGEAAIVPSGSSGSVVWNVQLWNGSTYVSRFAVSPVANANTALVSAPSAFTGNILGLSTTTARGTGYFAISYSNATATDFNIKGNGDVVNTNNSYGAISDMRLKTILGDARSQLDDFRRLKFRRFQLHSGLMHGERVALGSPSHVHIGLIAQEAMEVSPGLVERDGDGWYSIKYSVLSLKNAVATQELIGLVDSHETRLAKLEQRVA